ncbi:MAG: tryptophan 2,3-dioxygenase family protein [Sporichthyaceae bacterium]
MSSTTPQPRAARSFGEEGARLTYGSYLRLPELLDQQHLRSEPPAHDELLFISIHQVYELWFQQILHELEAVRGAMFAGHLLRARQLLGRVHTIERVLIDQVEVLETMTPQDFLAFRARLAPASGFQSVQFREIEFLSGAKDPDFVQKFSALTPGEQTRLTRRLGEPTLWDAFCAVVRDAGLPTDRASFHGGAPRAYAPLEPQVVVMSSLLRIARDRESYGAQWELAEALLTHDANAWLWRSRHVVMVERQIGTRSGTGGSSGGPYLRGRLPLRYYPLLWELRDQL